MEPFHDVIVKGFSASQQAIIGRENLDRSHHESRKNRAIVC
jgi:hypothetical protein